MTRPKPVPSRPMPAASEPEAPSDRKAEHISLALDPRMQPQKNYFDDYRFEHQALPELDYDAVDLSCSFLGRDLAAPVVRVGGLDKGRHLVPLRAARVLSPPARVAAANRVERLQ